jgi:membrane associated rhomboid family serine protease
MLGFTHTTPAVKNLLIVTVVMSAIGILFPQAFAHLIPAGAPEAAKFSLLHLIGLPWVASDPLNLIMACLALWSIGTGIEERIGSRRFYQLYLGSCLSAFLAAALSTALGFPSAIFGPYLAIASLIFALAWMNPEAELVANFVLRVKVKYWAWVGFVVAVLTNPAQTPCYLAAVGFTYLLIVKQWFSESAPRKSRARLQSIPVGTAKVTPIRPSFAVSPQQTEIELTVDKLMQKISQQGMSALTEDERGTLDQYSRTLRSRDAG